MEFLRAIFEYDYLANAVIACILSGITCGIIGTYIVARRMVFLCGGITHASFGGLGIAFYFGANPILGATIFAVLSALGIEWSNSRAKIRPDSAIGMVWGIGMAIGAGMYIIGIGATFVILFAQVLLHLDFHRSKNARMKVLCISSVSEESFQKNIVSEFDKMFIKVHNTSVKMNADNTRNYVFTIELPKTVSEEEVISLSGYISSITPLV